MIQLVIIGNGFDLAHGLETKYSDFIFDYLKKAYLKSLDHNYKYEDSFFLLKSNNSVIDFQQINDISQLITYFQKWDIYITYKHAYIEEIIQSINDYKWADIEHLYFVHTIKAFESPNKLDEIRELNSIFSLFRLELIKYLKQIEFKEVNIRLTNIFRKVRHLSDNVNPIILLNFNYTNTVEHYMPYLGNSINSINRIINIHGKLENEDSIIFGYGDETDSYYQQIERENNNVFFEHFKSFYYIQSDNYSELFNLLDKDSSWHAHIIGHSCGISDRILLKELFDTDKCERITIYPYKRKDETYDVTEKIQQISRHFSGSSKHKMRRKVSFDPNMYI